MFDDWHHAHVPGLRICAFLLTFNIARLPCGIPLVRLLFPFFDLLCLRCLQRAVYVPARSSLFTDEYRSWNNLVLWLILQHWIPIFYMYPFTLFCIDLYKTVNYLKLWPFLIESFLGGNVALATPFNWFIYRSYTVKSHHWTGLKSGPTVVYYNISLRASVTVALLLRYY